MSPEERAEKVAQLSPMRGARMPGARFNYALDAEERDIIAKGQNFEAYICSFVERSLKSKGFNLYANST